MRKLTAIILTICFGMLLPAAGLPVRVCLLDSADQPEDCCNTCKSDRQDCCADFQPLPDTPMPGVNLETPAYVGYVILPTMAEVPRIPATIAPPPWCAKPRTGVGPPTARLAVLNVWRL
jgi:hypothetical protein